MRILASAMLMFASVGLANVALSRDEVVSIDFFQSLSTNNPSFAASVDLNQLAQDNGLSLQGKTLISASMNAGGYGTLLLQANGSTLAQASIDPNVGYGTLQFIASAAANNLELVLQDGDMFIETIELTLRSAPIILPPPPPPMPKPVQNLTLDYYNSISQGQSVSFNVPAGQMKRITARWTDNTANTKVDFYIAGQLIASDVDVNSDGKGRVIEVNRSFPTATTLTLVVKNYPVYLERLEVEYSVPSNRFELNRDYAKDSMIYLNLNGGFLSKLRFSWDDNSKKAKTRVWINGEFKGEIDVNSNGQVKELDINQWLNPGSQLVLQVVNDNARINWVEAVFQ